MTDGFASVPFRFAGDMWAVFNFGDPNQRYQRFLARGRPPIKALIESLVLHRRVIVPTEDFLSLTVLVGALGQRSVIEMLEAKRLAFVRLRGSIAYVGNGGGLGYYEIGDTNSTSPHAAPADRAVQWALSGLNLPAIDPELATLAVSATMEIAAKDISEALKHETYKDILNSSELVAEFSRRNRDLDRLQGVGPKEVRIYGGPDADQVGDEIDVVLAIAAANVELRLAQLSGDADLSTAAPVGHLLRTKAERSLGRDTAASFAELREIADIPDAAEAVLNGAVTLTEILSLVTSRAGEQFQPWFHEHCRTDTITTAREYANLFKSIPKVQSVPAKILRFLVTTAAGKIPVPGVGEVVSLVDSFVIEPLLQGRTPKYFIEKLAKLPQRKRAG